MAPLSARYSSPVIIRTFRPDDTEQVVALWHDCDLTRPWNDPRRDIERSVAVRPDLFLVGSHNGAIVATTMGGYDGHRGWVYYVAVAPAQRGSGFGRRMMAEIERRLLELGCPKLNLLVRSENVEALGFYEALGYAADASVSLGKRLIED
jgi:ribosomal protein S18 acetylase RimI-like enzyme